MRAERLAVVLCTAATVGTCVFPTERDSSVHVSLTPVGILFRGNDTVVTAQAWQMVGSADSQPIPNVVFVWTSSDPRVATVDSAGHVVGVQSGRVVITAAAANFGKEALAARDTVRVAAPLEIDSVRPKTVRYGEILSVYGISVDSIFSASLHGAALIRVPFADTVFPSGISRSRWWVPPPAQTDSLFFLGITGNNGVLGYVHGDTTTVIERDLFEPDDTDPHLIDLDAPPPFPAYPTMVFFNPALAFETVRRPTLSGVDWYRFHQLSARDVTIILSAPQVAGTFFTYVTDSLAWNQPTKSFVTGSNSWSFGPRSHNCHGRAFAPSEAIADSTIVAFKNLPAGTLDALAGYTAAGRYGLTVIAGYQSELAPDSHEDDNSCNAADLRDTLQPPFRSNLAIENPHAMDWFRFHLTGAPTTGTTYQFRLRTLGGAKADSLKDLDLYVIKVPQPSDVTLQVVLADTASGSDVNSSMTVMTTGDYYVAVVDYAGAATMYEICVGTVPLVGMVYCNAGFPAPPASPSAPRRPGEAFKARLAPVPHR